MKLDHYLIKNPFQVTLSYKCEKQNYKDSKINVKNTFISSEFLKQNTDYKV